MTGSALGAMEQMDCTSRQLTTTTAMAPGSLTISDGDVMSSVSSTTLIQTAGASSTAPW